MAEIKSDKALDAQQEKDKICEPISKKILEIIGEVAKKESVLFDSSIHERKEAFETLRTVYSEKILPLLLENNVKVDQVGYIFQVAKQATDFLGIIAENSMRMNKEDAIKYSLGYDMDQMTCMQACELVTKLQEKMKAESKDEPEKKA